MKCPKCDYISFGDQRRCSNCGYDASVEASPAATVDLDLRAEAVVEGPPGELTLTPAAPQSPRGGAGRDPRPSLQASDLPLFDRPVPGVDDTPLLTAPSVPRPPLSVRRGSPEVPRGASAAATSVAPATRVSRSAPVVAEGDDTASGDHTEDDASSPAGSRLVAAAIDTAILLGIDLAIVYFTLRVTGLGTEQVGRLPRVPLVGFLLLIDLGYLVGFTTASGQTIGKMVTGIQVIATKTARVPLGQAIIRAVSVGLTWLSLGVGYLPALLSGDRRALHDRLAGTRVVRRSRT